MILTQEELQEHIKNTTIPNNNCDAHFELATHYLAKNNQDKVAYHLAQGFLHPDFLGTDYYLSDEIQINILTTKSNHGDLLENVADYLSLSNCNEHSTLFRTNIVRLFLNNTLLQLNPLMLYNFASYGKLINNDIKIFSKALTLNKTVQSIELREVNLTIDRMKILSKAFKVNKTLKTINLDCCEINDDGLQVLLESLVENNSLNELYLSANNITNAGVKILADFLAKNNSIRRIGLNDSNISDDGIKALIQTLEQSNTTVEFISLENYMMEALEGMMGQRVQLLRTGAVIFEPAYVPATQPPLIICSPDIKDRLALLLNRNKMMVNAETKTQAINIFMAENRKYHHQYETFNSTSNSPVTKPILFELDSLYRLATVTFAKENTLEQINNASLPKDMKSECLDIKNKMDFYASNQILRKN